MAGTHAGVDLEDFIGDWRDSLGHLVRVDWARKGNRGGELDVQLIRRGSSRDPIRLNVKSLGRGRYNCGHYELVVEESSPMRIVWGDQRNRGKVSVWEREGPPASRGERRASRSRSGSPNERRRQSGEVLKDRDELARELALRRSGNLPDAGAFPGPPAYGLGGYVWNGWGYVHQPYMPPPPSQVSQPPNGWQGANPGAASVGNASASVWREVSTPGAWAPPGAPPAKEGPPKEPGIYDDVLPAGSSLPTSEKPLASQCERSAGVGNSTRAERFLEVASLAYDQSLADSIPAQQPLRVLPTVVPSDKVNASKPLVPEMLNDPRSQSHGAGLGDAASSESGAEDEPDTAVLEPPPSPQELGSAAREPSELPGVGGNTAATSPCIDIASRLAVADSARQQEAPQDPRLRRRATPSDGGVTDTVVLEVSSSKVVAPQLSQPLKFDINPQLASNAEESRQSHQSASAEQEVPVSNEEATREQLSEYDALLLGGDASVNEDDPPWKRQKRRRAAVVEP